MASRGPLNFLRNTELGVEVLNTIASREALEIVIAAGFGGPLLADFLASKAGGLDKVPQASKEFILNLVSQLEQDIGAPIFQSFLQSALGINLSDQNGQEAQAVRMIERAIGFGAGVPAVLGPVIGILETKLGHHAPKEMFKAFKDIPHEIGMSFFLGTTLASIFEQATRGPIGEAIKEQTRPERLEWPQISRLLKSKQIDPGTATDRLRKAGFRDEDIPILTKLDNQLLSVTQVENLHEIGWFDDSIASDYLDRLGFEPFERDALMRQWAHNAASVGASSMRTVARNAFLDSHLSEGEFRQILASVETPPESIDLLVAGVQLERDAGLTHLSRAEIKDLFLNKHIDETEARHRLAVLGLPDNEITDLLTVWNDSKKPARSGIGTAKILGYLTGGIIDAETAYNHLIANGMRADDARFLVEHPTTHEIVKRSPISASTIISAYKDEVITRDVAQGLLESQEINPDQIYLLLANADKSIAKGKKPKKPPKQLTESIILDAVKFGLAYPEWAERELETIGWSPDDASLIVMIELAKVDPKNLGGFYWQTLT